MAEEDIIFGKNRHLFGGLEPSNMRKFESGVMVDGQRAIVYQLPTDTVIDGQTLCTVEGAMIRRKADGYPLNEFDGDLVRDVKIDKLDNPNDVYWLVDEDAVFSEGGSGGGDKLVETEGIMVINGSESGPLYSADGMTWTQSNLTTPLFGIENANGVWVGGGGDSIYYSIDGMSWEKGNTPIASVGYPVYGNGTWTATTENDGVLYSTDGKNWIQSNLTEGPFLRKYSEGIWVAYSVTSGMTADTFNDNGIYYSTDGMTWTQSNVTHGDFTTLDYFNGVWVAGSFISDIDTLTGSGMWYSEDGKTWTQSNLTTAFSYGTSCGENGMMLLDMASGGLYYSTDGKTWTQSNLTDLYFTPPCYANGMWFGGANDAYYSTDGINWTMIENVECGFQSVCYHDGNWVSGNAFMYGIHHSTDGINWTRILGPGYFVYTVKCVNGLFVAMGDSDTNKMYYSTDGVNWTQSDVPAQAYDQLTMSKIYVSGGSSGPAIDAFYYSAFPYTTRGVYNRNESNRFMISKPEPEAPEEPARGYLFGYDLDTTDSDPATRVSYPSDVDNAAFAAAYMDYSTGTFNYGGWNFAPGEKFMPKPCMLKSDGTVDHYLNPDDYTKKEDGTTSSVTSTAFDGNAMMEWPKIYTKRWEDEDGVYHFRCSDVKVDDDYECWCNYDINNNEIDHFYTAIYTGYVASSKLRSISGKAVMDSTIASTEITYAKANGNDWYTEVLADRLLIQDLLVMMAKSTDGQTAYGTGYDGNGMLNAGTMNTKGMFWGSTDSSSNGVKVFGMEHWWGNSSRRVAGWINNYGDMKVKLTRGTKDGSTATDYNTTGNGYIDTGINFTYTSDYISKMKTMPYGRIPSAAKGSSSTYECDAIEYGESVVAYAAMGGNYGMFSGPFYTYIINDANYNNMYLVTALSCKPSATN